MILIILGYSFPVYIEPWLLQTHFAVPIKFVITKFHWSLQGVHTSLNQCKILPFWSVFSLKFDLGVCKGVQFRFVGLQLPKGLEVFIKTNCWATWQCSGFLYSALSLYLRLFVSLSLCLSDGLFVCLLANPHAHLPFSLKRLYTIN